MNSNPQIKYAPVIIQNGKRILLEKTFTNQNDCLSYYNKVHRNLGIPIPQQTRDEIKRIKNRLHSEVRATRLKNIKGPKKLGRPRLPDELLSRPRPRGS